MAKCYVEVIADFRNIETIIKEIKELQTYKLSEDDDMILVDRKDVAEVLKNHIHAEARGRE